MSLALQHYQKLQKMDINAQLASLKKDQDFSQQVGMVMIHNGVVRGWSKEDQENVQSLEVRVDQNKVKELKENYKKKPGIFKIIIEAQEGHFKPGDDLLQIIVAGDVRENVLPVMSGLLDDLKNQALFKTESKGNS